MYFTQPETPNCRNIQAGVTGLMSAETKEEKVALTPSLAQDEDRFIQGTECRGWLGLGKF